MRLVEFFNHINLKSNENLEKIPNDDLFWFILDNDKLHKDYFFKAANKIKKINELNESDIYEMFMPMVIKGCKEYYINKKMEGRLASKFPKELREELCKKLYEHFKEDVKKGVYRLD